MDNDNKLQNRFSHELQKDRRQIKCVMLGASGTGKSSIVRRYIHNDFILNIAPSIGAAFSFKYLKTDCGTIKLDLWDTAGQERFDSIMPLYYKQTDIAVIVYDTTSHETFEKAKIWIVRIKKEVKNEPLFVLVGNKIDMNNHDFVEEVKKYACENNILYFECSAKTGHNVQNIFNNTCYDFIKRSMNIESSKHDIEKTEINNTIKLEINPNPQEIDYISSCMNVIKYPLNYVGIFKTK